MTAETFDRGCLPALIRGMRDEGEGAEACLLLTPCFAFLRLHESGAVLI